MYFIIINIKTTIIILYLKNTFHMLPGKIYSIVVEYQTLSTSEIHVIDVPHLDQRMLFDSTTCNNI